MGKKEKDEYIRSASSAHHSAASADNDLRHLLEWRRIVSESYLREALTPSAAAPDYGFLFWLGDGWYACRGYGGQRIHVFPKKRLIAVMQAAPSSRGMAYDDVIWHGVKKYPQFV